MNFVHIAGHLGADPEVRVTQTGKKVTTLRVATRSRKGQQDETIWWRVTIWDDRFDKMMPYLKKGSAVIVAGEMKKPEIFTDREGKSQISLEVTAVDIQFSPFGKGGSSENRSQETHAAPSPYASSPAAAPVSGAMDGFDSEVPF